MFLRHVPYNQDMHICIKLSSQMTLSQMCTRKQDMKFISIIKLNISCELSKRNQSLRILNLHSYPFVVSYMILPARASLGRLLLDLIILSIFPLTVSTAMSSKITVPSGKRSISVATSLPC